MITVKKSRIYFCILSYFKRIETIHVSLKVLKLIKASCPAATSVIMWWNGYETKN
jgi:hypothetical protein